jgi:hypothetical protein
MLTITSNVKSSAVKKPSPFFTYNGNGAFVFLTHPHVIFIPILFNILGNNIYDEEIPDFLRDNKDSEERSAYIIMDRIFPYVQRNYLIKKGEDIILRNVVNEIGIYGVLIGFVHFI